MKANKSIGTYIVEFIKCIWIYIIMITLIILYFCNFATANVVGSSMFPTYNEDDSLLLLKTNHLNRGDIVVVWSDKLNEYIVKRVIGVSGDFIDIENNQVYINNNLQNESYINEPMVGNIDSHNVVESESIFVMGDNRNLSLDSRSLGTLKLDKVKGVVILDLTKTLHYNRKVITIFLILVWLIFIIYLVRSFIVSYNKKRKAV